MRTEQTKLSDRSRLISKLRSDFRSRLAYIQAKVTTLVPSQIRALRLRSETPKQKDLAKAAELHQSRISMFETVGSNPTVETLSTIAAALGVGLKIEFVPFSEMLNWENSFSQDDFRVLTIEEDQLFLNPNAAVVVPVLAQTVGVYLDDRPDTSWINLGVVNVLKESLTTSLWKWAETKTEVVIPYRSDPPVGADLLAFNTAITNRMEDERAHAGH